MEQYKKKYDLMVYIGRFQPLHNAHAEIIHRAGAMAKKLVIILGSADTPRTFKNPFTVAERTSLLRSTVTNNMSLNEVHIEPVRDSLYNDQAWAARVQSIVAKYSNTDDKIGIIGHSKDASSFYLRMFPQWEHEEVELLEQLNASDIRDLYFRDRMNFKFIQTVIPHQTLTFLEMFQKTPEYAQIIREREFIAKYKKQFEGMAYPPIFSTADSVVIKSGHVLMVKRRSEPGKGLWALPGGFVNANTDKSVQDAAIRELREETGLKVPVPVLIGSIMDSRVFDAIDRSARGRTITHAFKIVLPDGPLDKVKGMDDAEDVPWRQMWRQIASIRPDECFDDHYDIITWAVGG